MTTKSLWHEYPLVNHAGREFRKVPRYEMRKILQRPGTELGSEDGDDDFILIPEIAHDDKREFPGNPAFEAVGPYLRAGIALHVVDLSSGAFTPLSNSRKGLVASDLGIFDDSDLFFECASVLEAHGWAGRDGSLSDAMVTKVVEIEGDDFVAKAKERFGTDGWRAYAGEVAALHFAVPMSRLWYAANLQSLYYAHYDDLRLGYLLAEYRVRMRYELFALKHIEMTEKNRESGQKGGQAAKKRERYDVLDRLARSRFRDFAFISDSDRLRLARRIANEYDSSVDVPLFQNNGKSLSRDWYEDWWGHFQKMARAV